MYSFIKNTLSSALGVIIAVVLLGVISLIMFVGVAASASQDKPSVKKNSILHISLSGEMVEQKVEDPLEDILGNTSTSIGLNELCTSIQKAKDLKEIKGIYLEAGMLASDPASLEELHRALLDFKKSGKFILSYGNTYTQGAYYLCSVADRVMLNPSGQVDWKGLASQPMFYKDMLEKFGIKMQVFRVGTYKSAVEPFTSTAMSPANREQVTSYMQSIWRSIVSGISASRKISADSLNAYADRYLGFAPATDLVKIHLVDTLVYIDGAKAMLKQYTGISSSDKLNLVKPSDVCPVEDSKIKTSSNKIAVYYAAGEIVDQDVSEYSNTAMICAPKVISDLQNLADDDDVKAVVMRINSGGGSAYASEQIWHAMKMLGQKKPVVVSMGGMAASGAYYMSSAAMHVVAEPTTITGSIGIFGMIPDVSTLLKEKLNIHFDVVKTNRFSDIGSISRPFNPEEAHLIQGYIERGYALFLDRVAKGRHKTPAQVNEIAQGRVWTGEQGLKIGLVDELGNLQTAIDYAAKKAGIATDYETKTYPEPQPWYLSIINKEKDNYYESKMRATLGDFYEPFLFLKTLSGRNYIQARIPYEPNIF